VTGAKTPEIAVVDSVKCGGESGSSHTKMIAQADWMM
jgi:hypothetical protein